MTRTQKHLCHNERKRAIALAVRALIVEKGFEGLRTRDIAERVGINIATLHYHVPSKEALIELVASSMGDDFAARHLDNPRSGLTPLEELRFELSDFRHSKINNPDLLSVMEELSRRARHDDNIAKYIVPIKRRWHQIIADILDRGRGDGTFRDDIDPAPCARMIIASVITLEQKPLETLPERFSAIADEIIRSVLSPSLKEANL